MSPNPLGPSPELGWQLAVLSTSSSTCQQPRGEADKPRKQQTRGSEQATRHKPLQASKGNLLTPELGRWKLWNLPGRYKPEQLFHVPESLFSSRASISDMPALAGWQWKLIKMVSEALSPAPLAPSHPAKRVWGAHLQLNMGKPSWLGATPS